MGNSLFSKARRVATRGRFIRYFYYLTRVRKPPDPVVKLYGWYAGIRAKKPPKELTAAMKQFAEQVKSAEQTMSREELIRDMLFSKMYDGNGFSGYFVYKFWKRGQEERDRYICRRETSLIQGVMNDDADGCGILKNKYKTYQRFREFYKRELILVKSEEDSDRLRDFCQKSGRVILKPFQSGHGRGIRIYDAGAGETEEAVRYALQIAPCVAEECIAQSGVMKEIHPQSVNTVRALTFFSEGKANLLYALIRTGSGGAVVDNLSSGGIGAAVDTVTGEIVTDGYSEDCRSVRTHPDTGVPFRGTKLPEWDSLIRMVGEMHQKLPKVQIIGWDLAYSERGWCMIEANSRPSFMGIQMCREEGFRPVLEPFLKKNMPRYYGK